MAQFVLWLQLLGEIGRVEDDSTLQRALLRVVLLAACASPALAQDLAPARTAVLDAMRQSLAQQQPSDLWWLDVAGIWPDPAFVEPLLRVLTVADARRVADVAAALGQYRDHPGVEERVATILKLRAADGTSRLEIRAAKISFGRTYVGKRFPSPDSDVMLPLNSLGYPNQTVMNYPGSIPMIASQLRDDRPGIALRAFAWLACRGIVVETGSLAGNWSSLDQKQKVAMLWLLQNVRVGRGLVIRFLDARIADWDQRAPEVQAALLMVCANLAHPEAERLARLVNERWHALAVQA